MKTKKLILFIIVILAAAAIRLPQLSIRALHTDEAIHAVKLGELIEHNDYKYDWHEYHGPTLNYFSLVPAVLRGQFTYPELDEFTLRVVTVFFGLLLILLLFPLVKGLGWPIVISAGFLTAISPVMVFYSRYYIMEILLVAFSFGVIVSAYRYLKTHHIAWAIWMGVFIGLMHATKETCIIVWGAMGLALLINAFAWHPIATREYLKLVRWDHVAALFLSAVGVSILFFSSFFANPRGIVDSVITFTNYFNKAGNFDIHIYPWYWYLKILLYNPATYGVNWSEGFIFALALVGLWAVFSGRCSSRIDENLLRFIALFTLILTVLYSAIPYKTPWIVLGFWHGFIILAAAGLVFLLSIIRNRMVIGGIVFLLLLGSANLLWQSLLGNFKYYDDPSNPWVFSHPQKDVFAIRDKVTAVAKYHPDGNNVRIDVICAGGDYWPLPWYLREFPRIGWWTEVNMDTPAAPIVLVTPALESELARKLYEIPPPGHRELYMPLFDDYRELRPMIEIRGYVVKSLFDKYYYEQPPITNQEKENERE